MKVRKRYVAIKPRKTEAELGGFYIPEAQRSQTTRGDVVAVGELVDDVKQGDVVIYFPSNNAKVDDVIIVSEEDIIAVE
jgi:co-chaperonin GroES (HSP10)